MAAVVLGAGLVLAFLAGSTFKASVLPVTGSLTAKTTNFLSSPEGGGTGSFNWLFAMLVAGPAVVASAVLYSASEIASAVRRSGRSRSGSLEVGDEV